MKETDLKYFEALTDVFLNSIRSKNHTLSRTISSFYYHAFKKERDKSKGRPITYPDAYYQLIYKSVDILCQRTDYIDKSIDVRTAGSMWLLGEFSKSKISEKTYLWIWRNLRLALSYDKDEMVIYHWETAHQYLSQNLNIVQKDFEYVGDQLIVKNETEVTQSIKERDHFLEFHYALGGLLLYLEKYHTINKTFVHTTSQPPDYPLLPQFMDQIFWFFDKIRDSRELNYTWISNIYPFPGLGGMQSDYEIKKWIGSYMALLFLRQYKIHPYYMTMRPLEFPEIPKDQNVLKSWLEGIPIFKTLVKGHLENKDLLKSTGLNFITLEWCIENNKSYPTDYLDDLERLMRNKYEENAINLTISESKVMQFFDNTRTIIRQTFENFVRISNKAPLIGKVDTWYVPGGKMKYSKDAFSDNPMAHYIDFDTFLAKQVSKGMRKGLMETFLLKRDRTYLIEIQELFKAVEALKVGQEHIIIAIGVDLEYLKTNIQDLNIYKNKFKNSEIIALLGDGMIRESLFIVNKKHLPTIEFMDLEEELINKYQLQLLDNELNLQASVLDLNLASTEILSEFDDRESDEVLRKSVLLCAFINMKISWASETELIQLKIYSKYREEGLPNKLNDIVPLSI